MGFEIWKPEKLVIKLFGLIAINEFFIHLYTYIWLVIDHYMDIKFFYGIYVQ